MLVRQAANVFEILEFFAERQAPATAAEIADALGWPRSSTFNLVATIVGKGYLYEPHARNLYYPTDRLFAVASRIADGEPLGAPLVAAAEALRDETQETVVIGGLAGKSAVFLHVAESPRSIRYFAKVGQQVPIHASSLGRALLAQLGVGERKALYRKIAFERFTEHTPASAEEVEAKIERSRARGFHQSFSEYEPDLAGVAMPVAWADRRLSMVVVGPVSRCAERREELARTMAAVLAPLGRESTAA